MKQPDGREPWHSQPFYRFFSPSRFSREFKQTFRSLGNRDFRVFAIGQLISLIGTWMQTIALSWLTYELTDSALALGLVGFAGGLPLLLLTYPGGIIADRFDRKRILVIAQVLSMAEAAVLTFLTFSGLITVGWLIGLALARGAITAMELPARQSFVPALVASEDRTNAIGINSAIWNLSRTLGPAIAGVLMGVLGAGVCFALNTLSYLASLWSLSKINSAPKPKTRSSDTAGASGGQPEKSTWAVLMDPSIKYVMLLAMAACFFGFQYGVLLPVVASKTLGGGAATLGFLSAAAGIGALFGSLALANRGKSKKLRLGIGFSCLVLGAAIAVLAYSTSLTVSLVAVAIAGACLSLQLSGGNSLVQGSVSESHRGRVMGVYSTFMIGFAPFAAMMAGWLADLVGVSITLYISALGVFLSALMYIRWTRKHPIASDDDTGSRN